MSAKKSVPLADRLYSWSHYAAVARMVRYETLLYEDVKPYVEELGRRFGAEKVREAVLDVCQTNWQEQPVTIALRAEVRKHCFQLLGPAPEQEDEFYRHPGGQPRERPPKKLPDAIAWKAQGGDSAGARPPEVPRRDREDVAAEPPTHKREGEEGAASSEVPTGEACESPLARLADERLVKRYRNARAALRFHDKQSETAADVRRSLAELVAEFDRRGLEVPGRKTRL
ncbi:MAG: hypothetical protein U0746_10585 [Gemmataceae bacterium]